MVEAAFVMPIFVLFLFGIIEFSGYLLTKEGTTNTAQAGARMASVQGNDAMADQQILARMADEAGGIPNGEIKQIVIWHASSATDTPPAACTATGSSGVTDGGTDDVGACNVYNDPQAPGGAFDAGQERHARPPTSAALQAAGPLQDRLQVAGRRPQERAAEARHRAPATHATTPDYVGIYVKALHRYYTGLFGSAVTITDQSIGKIEPETFTTL